MIDLHVIGAGPTGCTAAIVAAQVGKKVLLSEEHKQAGGKSCSGLFSLNGLKTLKKYIDWEKIVENEIYGADIYFCNEFFTIQRKSPVAAVCAREKFDRMFADAAEKEGVVLQYRDRVEGNYQSKNIIGADGAFSSTASFFNFPKIENFVGTIQGEVSADWEEKKVKVFFSPAFYGFLGWVVPKGQKRFEIGCGIRLPNNPAVAFAHLEKKLGIKALKRRAYIIPISARKITAKRVGAYDIRLVGDAAGQVKPTTGGGVIFGCWCAEIAATASTSFEYEFKWRLKYGKHLFLHKLVRSFLDRRSPQRMEKTIKKLKKDGLEDFLSKHGDMEFLGNLFCNSLLRPDLITTMLF